MTVPLVSIAIPAYRHARYIETCLASVCAQTYPELELVLIDDGSPDDTFEIAQRFLADHGAFPPRRSRASRESWRQCQFQCLHRSQPGRMGASARLGRSPVSGKVARIQSAIAGWNCPELALVHTDTDTIDADGVIRPVRRPGLHADAGVDRAAYRWLFHRNLISNPSIALRREAFLAIGGFDPALPLEDIDCWLRLSARYAIARLPETLASYRKHQAIHCAREGRCSVFFLTYAKFIDLHLG